MKVREGIGMLERGLPLARSLYPAGSDALQTRHAELAGAFQQDAGDARRAPQYYDNAAEAAPDDGIRMLFPVVMMRAEKAQSSTGSRPWVVAESRIGPAMLAEFWIGCRGGFHAGIPTLDPASVCWGCPGC